MHQLARLSIGRLRVPVHDPRSTDFVETFERVEAASELADGFVWRNEDRSMTNRTSMASLTVWRNQDALSAFITGPTHRPFSMRREDWFECHPGPHEVIWWVNSLRLPCLNDAIERLQTLRVSGPTLRAFTLDDRYPPN